MGTHSHYPGEFPLGHQNGEHLIGQQRIVAARNIGLLYLKPKNAHQLVRWPYTQKQWNRIEVERLKIFSDTQQTGSKEQEERTWSSVFTPQSYGNGNSGSNKSTKKFRSPDIPVLYTEHLFTGYIPGTEKLAVFFKTGKSNHFEEERRFASRTFGLLTTKYEINKVNKKKQGPGEVDKRNALRTAVRKLHEVFHFGENDAVVISSIKQEKKIINQYFRLARRATNGVK